MKEVYLKLHKKKKAALPPFEKAGRVFETIRKLEGVPLENVHNESQTLLVDFRTSKADDARGLIECAARDQ